MANENESEIQLMPPVTKAAMAHNREVLSTRKAELGAYVQKVASDRKITTERAYGDLALGRDVEYRRLTKRVSEAERVAPSSAESDVAAYRAWDAQGKATTDAESMKRATAEAAHESTMTPSERELHKRAAALAKEKNIGHGNAMGLLMETSKEARELYKKIAFEKVRP